MDAVTKHIAFMGALTLSNRSMQGTHRPDRHLIH